MDMTDLTSDDRAEIAKLYVRHLGETSYTLDDIEFSPTRAFLAFVQEPFRPGRQVLSDEEILSPLQVTLHREDRRESIPRALTAALESGSWGPPTCRSKGLVPLLRRVAEFIEHTAYSDRATVPTYPTALREHARAICAAIDRAKCGVATTLQPYYTADPAFLDWLEDETRGWPVLCEFLDYFNPPWFQEYVKTLAEDAQAAEDADRQETRASMQGVAGDCNRQGADASIFEPACLKGGDRRARYDPQRH